MTSTQAVTQRGTLDYRSFEILEAVGSLLDSRHARAIAAVIPITGMNLRVAPLEKEAFRAAYSDLTKNDTAARRAEALVQTINDSLARYLWHARFEHLTPSAQAFMTNRTNEFARSCSPTDYKYAISSRLISPNNAERLFDQVTNLTNLPIEDQPIKLIVDFCDYAFRNPYLPAELYFRRFEEMSQWVSKVENWTYEALDRLPDDEDETRLPSNDLRNNDWHLCTYPQVPFDATEEDLDWFAYIDDDPMQCAILAHPRVSQVTATSLAVGINPDRLLMIPRQAALRIVEAAQRSPSKARLLRHFLDDLPIEAQALMAHHPDAHVRVDLARHVSDPSVLAALAADTDPNVRVAVQRASHCSKAESTIPHSAARHSYRGELSDDALVLALELVSDDYLRTHTEMVDEIVQRSVADWDSPGPWASAIDRLADLDVLTQSNWQMLLDNEATRVRALVDPRCPTVDVTVANNVESIVAEAFEAVMQASTELDARAPSAWSADQLPSLA